MMLGGDEHGSSQPGDQKCCPQRGGKHPLEYAIFAFLVLTFVATSVAACYTRNQWITAADTEKRQLRAYIFLDIATMSDFGVSQKPMVKMTLKNFGQTPGYETVIDLGISPRDPQHPGEFGNPGHPSPPSPIAPGNTLHPILTVREVLDEPTIAAVKNGSLVYFVYGTITYKDTFGRDHWTKIRSLFGAVELAAGGGSLTLYREGNDADRDP